MAASPASAHAQLLLGMQIDLECLAADRHARAVEQTNPAARSPVTDVTEDAQPSGFLTEEEATPEITHKKAPWNETGPGDKPELDPDAADADADGEGAGAGGARSKKQAWTPQEDEKLLGLVAAHGPRDWSTIAAHIEGRLGKQCRERWHNHLSPAVKKEGFTAEEDRMIVEAVAQHGTKWAHMVKLIPGRTDNAIKNRWNATTRRLLRVQKRDGVCPIGLDLDLATLAPADLAKHLLASGMDPMASAPPAKRKIALPEEAAADAADAAAASAAQGPQGLQLLSHLSGVGRPEPTASPRVVQAALSLGTLTNISDVRMPPPKRQRRRKTLQPVEPAAPAQEADEQMACDPESRDASPRTMRAAMSLLGGGR
tara:strand:- start:211 stop:1323 length:1113 start_codon:yes stop_codon:yes gene_type:complete